MSLWCQSATRSRGKAALGLSVAAATANRDAALRVHKQRREERKRASGATNTSTTEIGTANKAMTELTALQACQHAEAAEVRPPA
jgi:hypothetical protein